MSCVYAVPEYLRIFDQLLEATLSVFDALPGVIEAVENLLVSVRTQLLTAIGAVFESWMSARAVTYRKLHGISGDWGTAVTVQALEGRQRPAGSHKQCRRAGL